MNIVGYTYRADVYCPLCILHALRTGEGQEFDGWEDLTNMGTEDNLAEIAYAFQIDRMDEWTFDSDHFPKVIFSSQVEDDEPCATCGENL